jgi:hypothetical protein
MASRTVRLAATIVALAAAAGAGQACGGGSGGAGGTGGSTGGAGGNGGETTSSSTTSSSSSGTGGTGGTNTGGTGGAVTAMAVDTCAAAAAPVTLAPGDKLTFDGTTAGATDDYNGCGADGSPDVVVAFTLTAESTVDLAITAADGSSIQPAIDIRSDCALKYLCSDYGMSTETMRADIPAGTYYLIVDGQTTASGAFTATMQVSAPKCGDAVLNSGEECDPGAGVNGDGCGDPGAADACKYQAVPAGNDTCPGESITVPGGTTVLAASMGYSTYGYKDDYTGSCGFGGDGSGGRERVFQIKPTKSGMLKVSVGYKPDGTTPECSDIYSMSCWDYVLYARTTCDLTATELGCSDSTDWFEPETLTFPVVANVPVFVFVDGLDNDPVFSTGPFNLVINLQ